MYTFERYVSYQDRQPLGIFNQPLQIRNKRNFPNSSIHQHNQVYNTTFFRYELKSDKFRNCNLVGWLAMRRWLLCLLLYCSLLFGWHMLCSSYYTSYYTEEPTTQRRSTRSQASIPKKSSVPVSPAVIPISAGLTPEGGTDSPNEPSRGGYGDKTPASEEFAPLKPMKSVEGLESRCPTQRPIHCVLTAQATVYQQWQARIMYFHWKKQARADGECTDMTGFTRLVASENGKPDGLEDEMPSVFVKQLSQMELSKLGHFGVLNRPYSVVQFIAAGHLTRIKESFVYIAEVRDCPRVNASLLLFLLCLSSQVRLVKGQGLLSHVRIVCV